MELIDRQRQCQSLPNRTIHCQPVQNRHDMMDALEKCIFFLVVGTMCTGY